LLWRRPSVFLLCGSARSLVGPWAALRTQPSVHLRSARQCRWRWNRGDGHPRRSVARLRRPSVSRTDPVMQGSDPALHQ
jgi:hypothetical protein